MTLQIAPVGSAAVEHAVKNWHYSRRMPTGRLWSRGVWENGSYIGAVVFGRGANDRMLRPFGLKQDQGCELVRVALRAHEAPVSQIVAECLRQLKAANPGLRVVISYADPEQGHHGGIYQAGGWFYLGPSAKIPAEWVVRGRRTHARTISAKLTAATGRDRKRDGESRAEWIHRVLDPGAVPIYPPQKHRYAMPLDKPMRRLLNRQRLTYPQRAAEGSKVIRPASAGKAEFNSQEPLQISDAVSDG